MAPELLDGRAALEDARLVLGIIDMLESLDGQDDDQPLEKHFSQLDSWFENPRQPAGRQLFGRLMS